MAFHHSLKARNLQRVGEVKKNEKRREQRNRSWQRVGGCTGRVQKKCWSWRSRALENLGDWNSRRLSSAWTGSSLFTRLSITPARFRHRNVSHFSSVHAPRDCTIVIPLNQSSVQLRHDHSSTWPTRYFVLLNIKATSSGIHY